MSKTFTFTKLLIFIFIVMNFSIIAQDRSIPRQSEELGIFEHLDSTLSDDLKFTDANNQVVYLKDFIKKPTVINLVYYKCPGICSAIMGGLSDVVKQSDIVLGTEYQIVTISFDASESYKLARKKKDAYIKINSSSDVKHAWKFFVGDQENVTKLLNELGFKVKKEGKQFIHPAALMVVSADRKITRYLNGTYYNPFDFKLALVEASEGRSGPTINKVLNYCFSYDPAGKKYVFDITKVAGSVVIFFAALLLFFMLIAERKRKRKIEAQN